MSNCRYHPPTRNPAEAFIAKLAANFPDLVDGDCERAIKMHTDPEELIEFLEELFKEYTNLDYQKGTKARIGRLALDRARNGKPKSNYVQA